MPISWFRKKRVRRDYSRKSFNNPLFDRSQSPVHWRRRITLLAVPVALGGWVWFLIFSPTFRIDEIEIIGNKSIPTWEIRDVVNDVLKGHRWLFMPHRSLLVASEDDIVEALNDHYVLGSLTVSKNPPRKLVIEIEELVSAVLLSMPDGRQGLVDLNGNVTRLYAPSEALSVVKSLGPTRDEATNVSKPKYPVLFDDRDEKLELREDALEPSVVRAVIDAPNLFEERFGRAPYLNETRVDGKSAQTLRLVTSEGWSIYIDANQGIQEQLANAEIVLRTKVATKRSQLDYIDARFGEKIFFKLRDI